MTTVDQLIKELQAFAQRYGNATPVYVDAPGLTTPDFHVQHVKLGCDRILISTRR
jgi:thiazole synthase ThiGH ThiG subunit